MKNTQINKEESKLVVITRSDLTPGYQAQQSTHSVADFANEFPQSFNEWKTTSTFNRLNYSFNTNFKTFR